MGIVFGKTGVAEPTYKVLMTQPRSEHRHLSYEIRQYGPRFVAETYYYDTGDGGGGDSNNSPFRLLAQYIGVFGDAQNNGNQKLAMTAPVSMGTKIAMTAPVSMKEQATTEPGEQPQQQQSVMQFFLPQEYQTLESIPQPTNDAVHIRAVPAATGAVYRFSGSMNPQNNRDMALRLAAQLRDDGVALASDEYVLQQYEFWGYNPPFTLPMFRRNEIWVELDSASVDHLVNGVTATQSN